uniref:Uncharacterized protein n=1 Tax=Arundo donax TaxID=35708 RepID=A0A0A8Z3P6_ARUDO
MFSVPVLARCLMTKETRDLPLSSAKGRKKEVRVDGFFPSVFTVESMS